MKNQSVIYLVLSNEERARGIFYNRSKTCYLYKSEYTRKEKYDRKRTDVLNCGYTFLSIHDIIFGDL